tara:strand:- start:1508 stop:2635 length:1128 start_codon:yes stop_codon:yes gene_type:complete
MNIYWCTTRHFQGDLCATTQVAIIRNFISAGYKITVLGPDLPNADFEWNHIPFKQSSIKGRKASSLGKKIQPYLKSNVNSDDILFIDWPLVGSLSSFAEKNNIRWVCIDRSPPADSNIYAQLQRRVWRKAWRLVHYSVKKNGPCIGGAVVSDPHRNLIVDNFSLEKKNLCVVHAGFDSVLFGRNQNKTLSKPIQMVYHGKMDRNRGILKLILLLDALLERGLSAKLNLIGSGDLDAHLLNLSAAHSGLEFHGPVAHEKIPEMLRMNAIGLLPMPKLPAWEIASPLKRSEYLASGLLVLGINHQGHQLPVVIEDSEWYQLFTQQTFVEDATNQIVKWNEKNNFSTLSNLARDYAESYLEWKVTTQSLIEWVESFSE